MHAFGDMIDRKVSLMASDTEIVREIRPPWAGFSQRIWDDGTIGELCKKRLLVDTKRCLEQDVDTSGKLRFSQPRLPYVSYPHEWSASMFNAAAETCLSMHELLFTKNLCLIDSHPWNILFDGPDPLWVDLTSIEAFDPSTAHTSLNEFRKTFLNTLDLLRNGNDEIVRSMLAHRFSTISDANHHAMIRGGAWRRHRWRTRLPHAILQTQLHSIRMVQMEWRRFLQFRAADFSSPKQAIKVITRLRRELARLPTAAAAQASTSSPQWGREDLRDLEHDGLTPGAHRHGNPKVRAVDEWLTQLRPQVRTVLDLGRDGGLFAKFAAIKGYTAATIDADSSSIDILYASVQKAKLPIRCGIVDFVSPQEGHGMLTNPLPRFIDRFRSDLVILTAAIHHLYFGKYRMTFRSIARLLSMYAGRFLIIEFIPGTDAFLRDHYGNATMDGEYTLECFAIEFSCHFRTLEILPSVPEGRYMYLMEKLSFGSGLTS